MLEQILEKRDRTEVEQAVVDEYVKALRGELEGKSSGNYAESGGDTKSAQNGTQNGENGTQNGEIIAQDVEPYTRGQAAVKGGDVESLRSIGHEKSVADARIGRLFAPDEAQRVNDVVENGSVEDVNALLSQQTDPRKRAAIEKMLEAQSAYRGIEEGLSAESLSDEESLREEMSAYQSEGGDIVELELQDGQEVYYKSGNLENRYGSVMVSYMGDDGTVAHKQVPVRDILRIGDAVALEDYVLQRSGEMRKDRESQYMGAVNGTGVREG